MKFKNFPIKRVLTAGLVVALGFSLNACSGDSYNTVAPYGDITGNYATNGSTTLTNKQLYDMLRPTSYNVFNEMLEENLLEFNYTTNYMDVDYNVEDDYNDMKQLIIECIFYKEDLDDFLELSEDEFDEIITQLIDASYTSNVEITTADIWLTGDADGFDYSENIFNTFKLDLAKERYAKDRLVELIAKGEKYDEEDEDGNKETITNAYYISDEDIETYYNNTYVNQQDYHAVIVGFKNLASYNAAMNGLNLTSENVKTVYSSLYNTAFPYKDSLVANDFNGTNNTLVVNADKLVNYNSELASFIGNMEVGDFTTTYKEFGGRYYMVYRISEFADDKWDTYSEDDVITFADGEEKDYEVVKKEIYQEIFDSKLTSSFISTQLSEDINELIEEEKIEIFDPVIALIFAGNYSDYTYDTQDEPAKANVATINGKSITVNDFSAKVIKYYGVEKSLEYFVNAAIADKYNSELTDDEIEAAETSLEDAIDSYKNDLYSSNGVTSVFTEEQFLSMMYGYDNQDDVLKYYFKASAAVSYLTNDYNDLYWSLLSLMGQNNYNNFFSLDIKHVLLYVDYDGDGNLDDPEDFMAELTSTQVTAFQKAIVDIYAVIYEEAQYLSGSVSENLDRIVTNYNRDTEIYCLNDSTIATDLGLSKGTKWSAIAGDFNIEMKVEDLGTVDNSSASTYVTEFSEHVATKYFNLVDEYNKTVDTSAKDYLDQLEEHLDNEYLEEITTFDNLCQSVFGYHMLLSTGGKVPTSAEFKYSNDYKSSSDETYRIYENIEVYFDGEDGDITTLTGYSYTKYPSLDQLKVYVAELNTDDGVESLKSTTETIINGVYSTFISRWEDSSFINYLAYTQLGMEIKFDTNTVVLDDMFDTYWKIIERNLDNYNTYDVPELNNYDGWWDLFHLTGDYKNTTHADYIKNLQDAFDTAYKAENTTA